jgi:hypothetical protein
MNAFHFRHQVEFSFGVAAIAGAVAIVGLIVLAARGVLARRSPQAVVLPSENATRGGGGERLAPMGELPAVSLDDPVRALMRGAVDVPPGSIADCARRYTPEMFRSNRERAA